MSVRLRMHSIRKISAHGVTSPIRPHSTRSGARVGTTTGGTIITSSISAGSWSGGHHYSTRYSGHTHTAGIHNHTTNLRLWRLLLLRAVAVGLLVVRSVLGLRLRRHLPSRLFPLQLRRLRAGTTRAGAHGAAPTRH